MKTGWLAFAVGLALSASGEADEKKPVPLYTNEDLERVSPYRDQTGVFSEPAAPSPDLPAMEAPTSVAARGEEYWRREAARVRERVRTLADRADEIRRELREARSASSSAWSSRPRRASGASLASREARLAALERRMRDLESELADRARRAGALPGWLR